MVTVFLVAAALPVVGRLAAAPVAGLRAAAAVAPVRVAAGLVPAGAATLARGVPVAGFRAVALGFIMLWLL